MSEATVKALTDAVYAALEGSDPVRELDNEQVYEVARLAAQTIESAGTTKAIVRSWLTAVELDEGDLLWASSFTISSERQARFMRIAQAIREVSS